MSESVHIALRFNEQRCPCHYKNLYLNDFYSVLSPNIIGDGYLYLQWLFPIKGKSKWHTHTPLMGLTDDDIQYLQSSEEIKQTILASTRFILDYFHLEIDQNQIHYKAESNLRKYWLRGVGHEEKKLSRIMLTLKLCQYDELAENLQQISIQLLQQMGMKTGRDPSSVIDFWGAIFKTNEVY